MLKYIKCNISKNTVLNLINFYTKISISKVRYLTINRSKCILPNEKNLIFPPKLIKKKHKYIEHIYVNHLNAAKIIAKSILSDVPKNSTVLEVNPGNGFVTEHLLKNDNISKLLLYEVYNEYIPYFEELHSLYPDKIEIKREDFINLWKLAFRDKCDNGTRVQDMLEFLPKKKFEEDINVKIFAGVGSYNFFKHLINSLVYGTSLYSYGRCQMYLIVPPQLYLHLTANTEAGYSYYRATSVLFQIFFKYKFLSKIPKIYFLPTLYDVTSLDKIKKKNMSNVDSEFLYLVKIEPRRHLYELCSLEDMPAMWYFIKQSLVSRKNRVIPFIEKWAPSCGPKLIINSKRKIVEKLYKNENETDLPKYSTPCTTISIEEYTPINIFTEFGELTPSQILTLFFKFQNWPEYKESPFLASLENSLLKMEQANEDNVDDLEIVDEEDETVQVNESNKKLRKSKTVCKSKLKKCMT